jgi:hypothetical protein
VLFLIPVILIAYAGVRLAIPLALDMVNAARFPAFARRIASSDHVVVADRLNRKPAFTIVGEDAKKFVRAVACSRRWMILARGYDEPQYDYSVTFLAGTNALGAIRFAQFAFVSQWRRLPVAHAQCSAMAGGLASRRSF